MRHTLPLCLVLAGLLSCLTSPSLVQAQETASDYYRNSLVYTLGSRLAPGDWHTVSRSPEGLIFLSRWEDGVSLIDRQKVDAKSFIPTYRYLKADGSVLPGTDRVRFMHARPFVNQRALAIENSREALYGYLGTDGAWAIAPRFAEALEFMEGLALVREPGKLWGIIDPQGAWVLAPQFTAISPYNAMSGNGFVYARKGGDAEPVRYDARTGRPVPDSDPRVQGQPSAAPTGPLQIYRVEEARQWSDGGSLFGRSVKLVAPDRKILAPGVFNAVQEIRKHSAVVSLGYYGDWWGDGPRSTSYGAAQGAFALLDLKTMKFLVPPSASQIISYGPGQWFVRTHTGRAFIYDEAAGKAVGDMPNVPMLWFSGILGCGLSTESEARNTASELSLTARINDDRVRVRSRPDLEGTVVAQLSLGDPVTVKEFRGEIQTVGEWTGIWARVEQEEGAKGWVFSSFVDLLYYSQ